MVSSTVQCSVGQRASHQHCWHALGEWWPVYSLEYPSLLVGFVGDPMRVIKFTPEGLSSGDGQVGCKPLHYGQCHVVDGSVRSSRVPSSMAWRRRKEAELRCAREVAGHTRYRAAAGEVHGAIREGGCAWAQEDPACWLVVCAGKQEVGSSSPLPGLCMQQELLGLIGRAAKSRGKGLQRT